MKQTSTTSPLILTGTNTYTSATTIGAGATLQLGNQSVNNQILVGGTAIADAGTLIFAPGTNGFTYANVITGNGNITLNGAVAGAPAQVTLSATTSTFTGTYTLNQGRLVVTAQTNLGNTADTDHGQWNTHQRRSALGQ